MDFIDLSFMDFPVFNIADIGVTCGLALFSIGWVVRANDIMRRCARWAR